MIEVCERDVDFLLLEELQCNEKFRRWVLDKVGSRPDASTEIVRLARSVATFRGETDLLFVHRDFDGAPRAIMIENKIDAVFTPNQAERYHARGEDGIRQGKWMRYVVTLIAPRKRLEEPDTVPFTNRISYEEAAEQLSGDDVRRTFKRSILQYACTTAARPWVQVVDPEVSGWFRKARMLAAREYPDLSLPLERDRAAANTWMIFCPKGYMPSRLVIEIKPTMGAVDLRFWGVALGDLRPALGTLLTPDMETVAAGKSCAVRLTFPPADVRREFSGQEALLRPMFAGALELARFTTTHKPIIDRLLDS